MANELVSSLIIGLALGCCYALVALGLSILYGILGIVNFAHGEILLIGAYCGAILFPLLNQDVVLVSLAVVILGLGIGFVLNTTLFSPLSRNGHAEGAMVGSLGLSLFIYNAAVYLSGRWHQGQPVLYRSGNSGAIRFLAVALPERIALLGTSLSPLRIATTLLSLLAVFAVAAVVSWTQFGRALRAVAWDRASAASLGIDPQKLTAQAVAFAIAITCVAGVPTGLLLSVTPSLGIQLAVKSFAVVVCAGFGNIRTTLVLGILLGVAEALAVQFTGAQNQYTWVFGAVILLLLLRPTGLIGEKGTVVR